mgnify:CR=1 FL=1
MGENIQARIVRRCTIKKAAQYSDEKQRKQQNI